MVHSIAIVGGTGAEGRGLATRFALAGHRVALGGRDPGRSAEAADTVVARLAEAGHPRAQVVGTSNEVAAGACDFVVIAVPYDAQRATLEALAPQLADRIVISTVVPVRFERGPRPIAVAAGSAAEEAAQLLPRSRVVGAFHTLPAELLLDPARALDADVLVTGDDTEAKQLVSALAAEFAGVRAVDAGPLRYSRFVEGLTVLLIGINGRYKAHSAVRIQGLPA
ncbi:MAG: NADPH-dependent F420 reductase [Dehalococcoidia bacterium]|nr:NADPH-dependent F420 reductase [Dehalococcoidia bacterium]